MADVYNIYYQTYQKPIILHGTYKKQKKNCPSFDKKTNKKRYLKIVLQKTYFFINCQYQPRWT